VSSAVRALRSSADAMTSPHTSIFVVDHKSF